MVVRAIEIVVIGDGSMKFGTLNSTVARTI